MLPRFCKDEITLMRAPLSDGVRRERQWAVAHRHAVRGCSVQASSSDGSIGERESTSIAVAVYMPTETDVQPGDRMEFDGIVYEMVGEPERIRSPFGTRDAIRALFRRWRG